MSGRFSVCAPISPNGITSLVRGNQQVHLRGSAEGYSENSAQERELAMIAGRHYRPVGRKLPTRFRGTGECQERPSGSSPFYGSRTVRGRESANLGLTASPGHLHEELHDTLIRLTDARLTWRVTSSTCQHRNINRPSRHLSAAATKPDCDAHANIGILHLSDHPQWRATDVQALVIFSVWWRASFHITFFRPPDRQRTLFGCLIFGALCPDFQAVTSAMRPLTIVS